MTKNEFCNLFLRALNRAAENAEAMLARPIPRSFLIELHAPGSADRSLSIEAAIDKLFLDSDRFYKIIDIAIKEVSPGKSLAFVRASGHPPAAFSETWDPSDLGPFKQIAAEKIEDLRVLTG